MTDRVGALRERVTIEEAERIADGAGGTTLVWTPRATVWAEVVALKGAEPTVAERDEAHAPFRVTIRFRDDVTAAMRLCWRGRILNIGALRDADGTRRRLVIDCEEGAA